MATFPDDPAPCVSIAISTWNRAHLVGRAIRSALAQTFEDFELLVVDDGSSDGTPEVLAAVSYYGPTPQPASVMRATRAAILGQYGADDARVNAGIPDLEAALAGKTFEKKVYDGAGHAFNNDTGGAYNEAAAVRAWAATTAWLERYLA